MPWNLRFRVSRRKFDELREFVAAHPGLGPWFESAIRCWQRGDAETLDSALGVSRADAIRERDAALRNAAAVLAAEFPEASVSAWSVARILAQEIRRYESIIVPRLNRDPSTSLTTVQEFIHQAATQRCRMLRCQEGLYKLLA